MISIYWPYKKVPKWLETIKFSGESDGNIPYFYHYGFGFIIEREGFYEVYGLFGTFIKGNGAGMTVHITGGGKGVTYYPMGGLRFFKPKIWKSEDLHEDKAE